jgi:hypothetical protein
MFHRALEIAGIGIARYCGQVCSCMQAPLFVCHHSASIRIEMSDVGAQRWSFMVSRLDEPQHACHRRVHTRCGSPSNEDQGFRFIRQGCVRARRYPGGC